MDRCSRGHVRPGQREAMLHYDQSVLAGGWRGGHPTGLGSDRGYFNVHVGRPAPRRPRSDLAQPRKGSFDGHKPIDMNERIAPGPGGSEDDWPLSHRLGKDQPQSDTGVGRLLRLGACRSLWVGRVCTQELDARLDCSSGDAAPLSRGGPSAAAIQREDCRRLVRTSSVCSGSHSTDSLVTRSSITRSRADSRVVTRENSQPEMTVTAIAISPQVMATVVSSLTHAARV